MNSPEKIWEKWRKRIKKEWKAAFWASVCIGLLTHTPILLSDIPNHDGLASMYFDQNMITSGRWFLSVACGFSTYFTLPWVIGILGILFLALTSVALTEILEVRRSGTAILIAGLLVSFPALASVFAYVFTMDGYMLGILLSVLSVLFVKKYRYGFIAGAVCLAFSMGIYQAYLPFAVLLSIYCIMIVFIEEKGMRKKAGTVFRFLAMGVGGAVLYYGILQILLKLQGKELSSYQGISDAGNVAGRNLTEILGRTCSDFAVFTIKGKVLFNNIFSGCAIALLALLLLAVVVKVIISRKLWRSPWFYLAALMICVMLPIGTNIMLIVSPEINYHLLMRYQWILYVILPVGFADRYVTQTEKCYSAFRWITVLAAGILIFNYALTDNIAYSNLEKRYEKTYAYCMRLLDRMEQTEGYYPGIPVAMIGVVGDRQYPVTDITADVTGPLTGIPGDVLLYAAVNYQAFMKNYLGVEINPIDIELMPAIYDSPEYAEMDSFPGRNSVRVVDGVMYIKTENQH